MMNQSQQALVAAFGIVVFVAALGRAVAVLRGGTGPGRGPARRRGPGVLAELPPVWRANYRLLLGAAAVAAVLVWALAGRPVHGLIAFAAVAGLPFLLFPGGSARTEVEQLEAFSDWLQQLSSVIAAGKPLEVAIPSSLSTVPDLLRAAVTRLSQRLADGVPAAQAYRLFADDLASNTGDEIVMVFQMHTQARGRGLANVIKEMAFNKSDKAKALRKLDSDRARTRRKARNVTVLTLAVIVLGLTSVSYTDWYRTAPGQLGLMVVGLMVTGSLVWMRKTARNTPEPRLLLTAAERVEVEQP
ncbi:type II secretion system F family protein [Streptomyces sp. NPDC014685]|uniref:type II secretion system F family protein n=1 Tax=Streptomyces sp. NPDC014685 TaxID=3364881 RepID=UPI0036F76020